MFAVSFATPYSPIFLQDQSCHCLNCQLFVPELYLVEEYLIEVSELRPYMHEF